MYSPEEVVSISTDEQSILAKYIQQNDIERKQITWQVEIS